MVSKLEHKKILLANKADPNIAPLLYQQGLVEMNIFGSQAGRIQVHDSHWKAITIGSEFIPEGTHVQIVGYWKMRLIVLPLTISEAEKSLFFEAA